MEKFFGPGGLLAGVHPAYEHREGQERMATDVARVLSEGGRLMVEAGTGTGKTMAYLVPALLSGKRVVISTGTRNLQDQIYKKDLPFLRERLGLDAPVTLMKGRDNYLCRYRLAEFEHETLLEKSEEHFWIPRIAEWSRETTTGDRAEIDDLPDNLRMWRDVNARADTCTGRRCPEYDACWLTRVKREAQDAQIVVVNHHLFFADLAVRSAFGAVLPDYDTVIFDEAHLLEEIATLYFGIQVSSRQIEELARDAEAAAGSDGGAGGLRLAAMELFEPLRRLAGPSTGRARFMPPDAGGVDLEAEWAVLSEALDEIIRQAGDREETTDGADSIPRRAEDLRNHMTRILKRDDSGYVYGVERRGANTVILSASPIEVGGLLRERLFESLESSVLTSATLAVAGSFEFFQSRLGLEDAETSMVGSAFDHARQALLFLPKSMPEPREPEFLPRAVETIERLLHITAGRAFLLFTSHANLGRVHDALAASGRWPLLKQGDGSKLALVERFRATPQAVLCGTTSFWQGVDVPGSALSLVVVDKLPFDVPTDPLVAARIDRIKESGGKPFMDYQVPLAVLELKQGLGRLLRSRTDHGLLAVLDPRLTTRRYGKVFLESLPPYRVVRDLDACLVGFNAAGSCESD